MQKVKNRSGCGCCGAGLCVHVTRDCTGYPAVGLSVPLKKAGVLVGTVVTDADGIACFGGLPAGNDYTVDLPGEDAAPDIPTLPRWTAATYSYTVTGSDQTVEAHRSLGVANYACLPGCIIPIARSLDFTDSVYGSSSLTWSTTNLRWELNSWNWPGGYPGCGPCLAASTGGGFTPPMQYLLDVDGFGNYRLRVGISRLVSGNICPDTSFGVHAIDNHVTMIPVSTTCSPFELVFSGATHSSGSIQHVYCSTPTITITE